MSWPDDPPRRLLAAIDGSPTSLRAAEAAVAIADRHGADLVLLHVLDEERLRELDALIEAPREGARRRLEQNAERILQAPAELSRRRGVPCTLRIEAGDPPRVIHEVARKIGADLIVVGKVGQRGMRTWFVGSVTRRLIESTGIPVVVIPKASAGSTHPKTR